MVDMMSSEHYLGQVDAHKVGRHYPRVELVQIWASWHCPRNCRRIQGGTLDVLSSKARLGSKVLAQTPAETLI